MSNNQPNYDLSSLDLLGFLSSESIAYGGYGTRANLNPAEAVGLDKCPFCSATNNHAKIFYNSKQFFCSVCHASMSLAKFLQNVRGYSKKQAWHSIFKYRDKCLGSGYSGYINRNKTASGHNLKVDSLGLTGRRLLRKIGAWPKPIDEMKAVYTRYLTGRGYDIDYLRQHYDIHFTRPGNVTQWAHRIVIPFHDAKGTIVQATGRTIHKTVKPKYRDIAKEIATTSAKNVLYNLHRCRRDRPLIVVEGVTDVWRLGGNTVAVHTNCATDAQIAHMIGWPAVVVMLDNDGDPDTKTVTQANALHIAKRLAPFYEMGKVCTYQLPENVKDPDQLTQNQAVEIKREVLAQIKL